MKSSEEWPELIVHYRARHGLTQTQFAERIKVTQQTVSRWESGNQAPDATAQELLRSVMGLTALSSKTAWRDRVKMSWGTEALFEKDWRFLAVSPKLAHAAGDPGDVTGKMLFDLPSFKSHAPMLSRMPFFDGALRVIKVRADFCLSAEAFVSEIELWPVLTSGDEILAHAVVHLSPRTSAGSGSTGVLIRDFYAIMADGREVSAGNASTLL